ncbi:MAG: hypothetical protein ACI360_03740 [Atopobiaceae bacterium]
MAANYGLAIVPLCALGFSQILEQLQKRFAGNDEALGTIDNGDLVINIPNDGSCFSYALQRMNVYYHSVELAPATRTTKPRTARSSARG